MKNKLYQKIASCVDARLRCIENNNTLWEEKHFSQIWMLVKAHMPSGSGVDCGTKINLDKSTGDKLYFTFEYHHMDENGMYCGWTSHKVVVTPSLIHGINIRITGKSDDREYFYDIFANALETMVD